MAERKPRSIAGYGWKRDTPDHRDHRYATPAYVIATMPPKVDQRPQWQPPYNQGEFGCCTGNAIGGVLVYISTQQGKPLFVPSRMMVYYDERVMEGTVNADCGAEIRDGIASVCSTGVCEESLWPYDAGHLTAQPTPDCYAAAKQHVGTSYVRVAQVATELKGCLAHGFPVVFGMSVYESFEGAAIAGSGQLAMPTMQERLVGGHCVVLVGYDDATQCFIVRNSWGVGWGDGGYFYLPYQYALDPNLAGDFWTIRAVQ